jgi:hypothetical protein
MADLDISNNIFTENGSRNFKNKIAEKKRDIPTYSNAKLVNEKEHLVFRKHQMTDRISEDLFSPAQKTTYEIYLKDVGDVINSVDSRLGRGKGKGRGNKSKRKGKGKSKRKGKGKRGTIKRK